MAAYQTLMLNIGATSLSPVIDNPSFNLSFSTASASPALTDAQDLTNFVAGAMTSIPTGGTHAPSAYYASVISRGTNSGVVKAYDVSGNLTGTRHGSPVCQTVFTPSAVAAALVNPEGVAACITLQAPYGSDVEFGIGTRPRSRDRGRFYFGPICGGQYTAEATTNRCTWLAAFMTDMTKFVKAVASHTTTGSIPYNLCVWSRRAGVVKALQECWIDDRPDYQRRRADQGATRLIQTLP